MKLVKYLSFVLFSVVFLSNGQAFSLEPKKGDDSKLSFRVASKYPVNVSHVYKMIEKSKIVRKFSDNSTKEFNRDLTVYFSFYAPSKSEKGFTNLLVSIDSLVYKYSDDKVKAEYNSQDEDAKIPSKLMDYEAKTLILGKSFEMSYSPYGEVAKITGERLLSTRQVMNDPYNGIPDSLRKFIWNLGLSDDHLTYLTDLQKQILPQNLIDTSSVWRSKFGFEIEGIHFSDTMKVKMKDYNADVYNLIATSGNIKMPKGMFYINGFDRLMEVIDGTTHGTYLVNINPRGFIKYSEANFETRMKIKYKNEIIDQTITTKVIWELDKMYKV